MRKITGIEAQKKRSNRVNIYLDGDFAFGLERITAAWLRVGQELEEKKIEQLQAEDARERAHQQALLFLSYRARSESEIRKNLQKHEIPESVIEETLERLRRDGLGQKMAREAPGHTLQATALVHEAWAPVGGGSTTALGKRLALLWRSGGGHAANPG